MAASEPAPPARWMARGEGELPAGGEWLTSAEADHADALRFPKRRGEYLLRRWTCKHAVAGVLGLSTEPARLARIDVANLPSGAPHVTLDGRPVDLEISLTDRAGWAVCLVAEGAAPVGCDLEVVEPRSPGFVADFLTPAERGLLASLPAAERDTVANALWSAKESALKALGTGLRRDTRSVEVTLGRGDTGAHATDGWAPLEVRADEGDILPGWWRHDGAFVLTVAARRTVPRPTALPGSSDLATARPAPSSPRPPLRPER